MGDKWEQNPLWFIVNGFVGIDTCLSTSNTILQNHWADTPKCSQHRKKRRYLLGGQKVGRHCWSTLRNMPFVTAVVWCFKPILLAPGGPRCGRWTRKQCGNIPKWKADFGQLFSQSSDIWMVSHSLGDTQISNCWSSLICIYIIILNIIIRYDQQLDISNKYLQ